MLSPKAIDYHFFKNAQYGITPLRLLVRVVGETPKVTQAISIALSYLPEI